MHAVKRTHGSGGTEGAGRVGMEVQGYSLYIDIDEFAEFTCPGRNVNARVTYETSIHSVDH